MVEIYLTDVSFDPKSHWSWELDRSDTPPTSCVHRFDHHGYDLTRIESEFSLINGGTTRRRQPNGFDRISTDWFQQEPASAGAVINEASLMERKGFDGPARRQIESWTTVYPIFGRLLSIEPRWGLVFSIDWSDRDGNCFELLHTENDYSSHHHASDSKGNLERKLIDIDWHDLAARMLRKRQQWEMLSISDRRSWQADFIGI